MPIEPKHKVGKRGQQDRRSAEAFRQFVDRDKFIGVFNKAVSELPLKDREVLVYYGVGGIGKTSLRIELGRSLDEQQPLIVWAVLDFATPTHRNAEDALFWLRQELKRKYRVEFPTFDLAYAEFWQKSRPQIS